jgi:hypothetical protein
MRGRKAKRTKVAEAVEADIIQMAETEMKKAGIWQHGRAEEEESETWANEGGEGSISKVGNVSGVHIKFIMKKEETLKVSAGARMGQVPPPSPIFFSCFLLFSPSLTRPFASLQRRETILKISSLPRS